MPKLNLIIPFGRFLLRAALLCVALGCAADDAPTQPSEPEAADEPLVLFIGNSLTSSNDLPGLFETIAEAAGHPVDARRITFGGYSLEDHWNTRVGPRILALEPDIVIMQQGPSSLPQNQEYLKEWTVVLAAAIREAGGVPALLMVWPELARIDAFDDVHQSYHDAALAVDGRFIPAGDAFLAAHLTDELTPYSFDDFHPSRQGSIIAALCVARTLWPDALNDLPTLMEAQDPGDPDVDLGEHSALILQIVETAVEESAF